MLKEDYCSYEVAKLLKKKGFDELCIFKYNNEGIRIKAGVAIDEWQNSELDDNECSAPTHQMAMKWLRKKGIHMSLDTVISSSGNIYFNIDTYSEDSGWNHPVDFYDSYEEAVEAALKYSLENLI